MHESDPRDMLDEAKERCRAAERQVVANTLSEEELQRTLAHADEVLARLDGLDRRLLLAARNSLQDTWDERRDRRFAVPPAVDEAAGIVARALFTKGTLEERLNRAHEAMDEVERLIERTDDWVMEGRIRRELEPLMNQISILEARLRGEFP